MNKSFDDYGTELDDSHCSECEMNVNAESTFIAGARKPFYSNP